MWQGEDKQTNASSFNIVLRTLPLAPPKCWKLSYGHIGKWVHLSIDLTSYTGKRAALKDVRGREAELARPNNQRTQVIRKGTHDDKLPRLHSNGWKGAFWHVQWIQAPGDLLLCGHVWFQKAGLSDLRMRWVGWGYQVKGFPTHDLGKKGTFWVVRGSPS